MDTIASMRAFVAVAKTGSFRAAAQKLDLVPSVVTKRVTQLERIVGKTLFHRTTRKVVLSADGEHHLERIIAAIAAHDQALTELRKGVRRLTGPIRIKVSSTLGFLRLNALVRDFGPDQIQARRASCRLTVVELGCRAREIGGGPAQANGV